MTTVTFRNGTTVSDGSDEATTLRNGGHRTRFVPALVGTVEAAAEAKSWASLLGSVVYDSEYSAKEYAVGATCPSGSAKSWASGTGAIADGYYSARYYAEQSQTFSNSALNAPGTSATSVSPLSIGTGTKNLTIQTGKAFTPGQFVIIADQTVPANYMVGQILSHNSTTGALSVNVTVIGGTGTGLTNWIVSLTALANAAGAATLGGNNVYSGTNTYNAATSFAGNISATGSVTFSGLVNITGTPSISSATQTSLLVETTGATATDKATYKLKTGISEIRINLAAGAVGVFSISDVITGNDLIYYAGSSLILRKPQRTDAATSANDLVRKAELDNASVQSIVTTTQGALSGFRNAVVNGNMNVRQRSTSAQIPGTNTTSADLYGIADRWFVRGNCPQSVNLDSYYVSDYLVSALYASSGFSPAATNFVSGFGTKIEYADCFDLLGNGSTVTVSFLFRNTQAGTYSIKLRHLLANKECLKVFSYTAANTLQQISVTFPAFDASFRSSGFLNREFALELLIGGVGGTNYKKASADTEWVTGSAAVMVEGSVLWTTGTGNIRVTQVQLERGSVATPFETRPYQVELALCQRYYQTGKAGTDVYTAAGATSTVMVTYPVEMRTTPTVNQTAGTTSGFTTGTLKFEESQKGFFSGRAKDGTTGTGYWYNNWTASAE